MLHWILMYLEHICTKAPIGFTAQFVHSYDKNLSNRQFRAARSHSTMQSTYNDNKFNFNFVLTHQAAGVNYIKPLHTHAFVCERCISTTDVMHYVNMQISDNHLLQCPRSIFHQSVSIVFLFKRMIISVTMITHHPQNMINCFPLKGLVLP